MSPAELLVDLYARVLENAVAAVDGLSVEQLAQRPSSARDDANPVGWLVWHLARVQDDHVADVAGHEQVWTADGWARRFDLALDDADIGYGHTTAEVAVVRADAALLTGYLHAVHARSVAYVLGLAPADLARVVDERWDPPVTLGVRLVSVGDDGAQHAGQAAYARGLLGL